VNYEFIFCELRGTFPILAVVGVEFPEGAKPFHCELVPNARMIRKGRNKN
jgi:hypothetical protein